MCALNLIFEFLLDRMHKIWGNIYTFRFFILCP